MALIYIAGIVSGIILVTIALAGWAHHARHEIDIRSHGAPSGKSHAAHASNAPLARDRPVRTNRRHRAYSATP